MNKINLHQKTFQVFNYFTLLILASFTIYPFLYIIFVSFTSTSELANISGSMLYFPKKIDFLAYHLVFNTNVIPQAYKVSIFVTVVGTFLSLIVTVFTAYPLSRKYLPGKRVFMFLITFTILFSGGMIPTFIVVKNLGLIDSIWSLILPVMVNAFNTIIMKNYFLSIHESLEESAKIDGANDIRILFTIFLPLSTPILATIALFYAVVYWNDFFHAIIYINDAKKYTLQVILRQILTSASSDLLFDAEADKAASLSMRGATIVVTVLPIMMIYPFIQKYFTKGVLLGSIKE